MESCEKCKKTNKNGPRAMASAGWVVWNTREGGKDKIVWVCPDCKPKPVGGRHIGSL